MIETVPDSTQPPSLRTGLLAELRAALADYEINSVLRQDLGCLAVEPQDGDCPTWVFLSFGSRYFSWNDAQLQHPVFDIQGAARRIAAGRQLRTEHGPSGCLGQAI